MKKVRTRFAPSPTGFMHVGNLRSALYGYLFAKKHKGTFILRIEDTDLDRYVPGAVDVIYNTLAESGITFNEGPNEGGDFGPYVQSERKAIYQEYTKPLLEKGAAYYCFCTKERLESLADSQGVRKYDKHCLNLSKEKIAENLAEGVPYVIRQNMPTTGTSKFTDLVFGEIVIDNKELEDHVLLKSDGMPTYNYANVVDDHLMQITHVMRGTEYLSSTPKYNLLYEAFGWDTPEYIHLTPIMKDETRKLSKRHGDANFDDFIKRGFLPHAIINYIALLGWSPKGTKEKFTMDELIEAFDIKGLQRSGAIFDPDKMKWLNGQYIKELDFTTFMELATPFFDKSNIKGKYDYEKFGKLVASRIDVFEEIPAMVNFITEFGEYDLDLYNHKKLKINPELAKEVLSLAIPKLASLNELTIEAMQNFVKEFSNEHNYRLPQVYTILRIALTGVSVTPGGAAELADILGKEEAIKRLNMSLEFLNK